MSSYDVSFADVQNLQNDYASYTTKLSEAATGLDDKIGALEQLDSFQGSAASSIKGYFTNVHRYLLGSFVVLYKQLATEYADYYYSKFSENPISDDNANARWPSDALDGAERTLRALREGDLSTAESLLRQAEDALPAEYYLSVPKTIAVNNNIEREEGAIRETRNGVDDVETSGHTAFTSSSGDFEKLASALGAAISMWSSTTAESMTTQDAYTFTDSSEYADLRDAYFACTDYQTDKQDVLIASQKDSIAKEQYRIEEERKKEVELKRKACIVGTVAAIVGFVAATAALVATAGAASPLLFAMSAGASTLGLWSAGKDVVNRTAQLTSLYAGDDTADKEDIIRKKWTHRQKQVGEAFDDAVKTTKPAEKLGENLIKDRVYERDGLSYDSELNVYNTMGTAGGVAIDKAAEMIGDATGTEFGKTASKVGGKLSKQVLNRVLDKAPGASWSKGIVGTMADCASAVADYQAEQADKRIDELDVRKGSLDDLDAHIESTAGTGGNLFWATS